MSNDRPPPSRKRGAQPGNINALRHGFYSRSLRKLELDDLDLILPDETDSEIALLRTVIRRVMELSDGIDDLDRAMKLLSTISLSAYHLSAMIYKRRIIAGNADSRVAEALNNALVRLRKEGFMK